jgi:hypothetical protein
MEPKTKEIDGKKVKVAPFTGSVANKMFVQFSQVFDIARGKLLPVVDPDTFQDFCEKMLQGTAVDGLNITAKNESGMPNFDVIFAGKIDFLYDVLTWAGEVNFGKGFLDSSARTGTIAAE